MKLDRDRWWTFFSIDQTNMRFSITKDQEYCTCTFRGLKCFFVASFGRIAFFVVVFRVYKFSKFTLICRQILSGILEKLVWTHIFLSSISQNPAFDIQKTKPVAPFGRSAFFSKLTSASFLRPNFFVDFFCFIFLHMIFKESNQ